MAEQILFVDDDLSVLAGYRRQLRKQYKIDTAPGGEEGLAMVEEKGPYAVVVSDMRMPGMNGAQFLSAVRQKWPDCVRLLLTGQADLNTAIMAVNEGEVFRILAKPCPPEDMVAALESALERHRVLSAVQTQTGSALCDTAEAVANALSVDGDTPRRRPSRTRSVIRAIGERLGVEDLWRYELAAMFACVSESGVALGSLESDDAHSHDAGRTRAILEAIPGNGEAPGPDSDVTHIVDMALHLEGLLYRGLSQQECVAEVKRVSGLSDSAALLAAAEADLSALTVVGAEA